MSTQIPPQSTKQGDRPALQGNLGPGAIMLMVVAAAAPLTVVGGLVPMGILSGNGVGLPIMFIVAAGILLLFSVGLMALSRHIPGTGTFSSYIATGLGPRAGAAAAGLAMVCYSAVQLAVFSYLGATLSSSFTALGVPEIHWTLYTLVSIIIVGFLGYRRIELSSKVLVVVLLAEIGIIVLLGAVVAATGGAEGISLTPFSIENILSGSPALGLMFALAGFIGFESTVVYRSEAVNPDKTIRRATYGSAILVGVFYAFATWALIMAAGPSNIVAEAGENPAGLLTVLTNRYLGEAGSVAVALLFIGSMFAAVLSLHNVISRYQYSLARDGMAPAILGKVHDRHGSPSVSALVQVATAATMVLIVNALGITAEQLFSWGAAIGSIAIALLMAVTCVSVIVYFRGNRSNTTMWQRLIAPLLGASGLLVGSILIVTNYPLLVGDEQPDGSPGWGVISIALLIIVLAAPVIGWFLSFTRPLPKERNLIP